MTRQTSSRSRRAAREAARAPRGGLTTADQIIFYSEILTGEGLAKFKDFLTEQPGASFLAVTRLAEELLETYGSQPIKAWWLQAEPPDEPTTMAHSNPDYQNYL